MHSNYLLKSQALSCILLINLGSESGVRVVVKTFYDIARHLVWLTQFGMSVAVPPVLSLWGAVWLQRRFALGGWVVAAGFLVGLLAAVGGLRSSLKAIDRQAKPPKKADPPPVSFNRN